MSRVVAATFRTVAEAQIARSKLESEGIPALIPDENAAQLYPGLAAMGPVRLEVEEADILHARRILAGDESGDEEND